MLLFQGDLDDDSHAIVLPPPMNGGKRVHPLPYIESNLPVQARPMDPTKDLAAYGYGSVAWKDRVESWKMRQEKMMTEGSHHHKGGDMDGDNGPDLPMYAFTPNINFHIHVSSLLAADCSSLETGP